MIQWRNSIFLQVIFMKIKSDINDMTSANPPPFRVGIFNLNNEL